jgi:hypothetical protein
MAATSIRLLVNTFHLSKVEIQKYEAWYIKHLDAHRELAPDNAMIADLPVTFLFTNTGIGSVVEVRCNRCSKTVNISDYASW